MRNVIIIFQLILMIMINSSCYFFPERNNPNDPVVKVVTVVEPESPVSSADNGILTVSWGAVPGATAYEVWYSSINDFSTAVQQGGDITTTYYTITGLKVGTTYYVWVVAKNSSGIIGTSSVVTGTAVKEAIPAAPAAATITAGDKYLSLNWTAVSAATSYQVWYSTTNDSSTAVQQGGDIVSTSYIITGLTNGTVYYVWLKAKNSLGTSGFGAVSSGTAVRDITPSAPAAPSITAGDKQLTLSWTEVSGASSYEVWYSTTNDSSTATPQGGDITTTSYTITGLTNGTLYYVWLKAKNSAGTSGFGSVSSGTASIVIPSVPSAPSITAEDKQLTLSWTEVSGATSYEVWYSTTNDSSTATPQGGDITTTSYTIAGLTNGTLYYVWLKAKNSAGTSGFGAVSNGTASATTYKVTYSAPDAESGTIPEDNNSYSQGTTVTVAVNTGNLARNGYTLTGWADGTNTYSSGNTFILGTANITLSAVWALRTTLWAKTVTSASEDQSNFVSVSAAQDGSVYAAGYICRGSYDFGNSVTATGVSGAGYNSAVGIGGNIILVKYNDSGVAQWCKTVVVGNAYSEFESVATDKDGYVYAAGSIWGTSTYDFGNGITATGTNDGTGYSGYEDNLILVKYNGLGEALWAKTVLSGNNRSELRKISIAPDGSIYALGLVHGNTIFNFGNGITFNATSGNSYGTLLLLKYNSSGDAQWAKAIQVSGSAGFKNISAGADGSLYAAGYFNGASACNFGNNVTVSGSYNNSHTLLVKYSSSGEAQWAKTMTMETVSEYSESSQFNSVSVGSDGYVYASGYISNIGNGDIITYNFGNNVTASGTGWHGLGPSFAGNIVLVKYNSSGEAQWARTVTAGDYASYSNDVASGADGSIYVTGILGGTCSFGNGVSVSPGIYQGPILLKYNSLGEAQWAKSVSASDSSNSYAGYNSISAGTYGSVYAAGSIGRRNGVDIIYNFEDGVTVTGVSPITVDPFVNILIVKYR